MNPVAACYLERGIAHFRQNQFAQAITCFEIALQIDPNEPYARYNRATALLSLGDYERGFQEYEVTWRLFHWRGFGPVGNDIDRLNHLPLWRGESGSQVRLLLYHEMGHGDAIMAMRYLPEIKRRTDPTLVLDQCLNRLARGFGIEVTDTLPDDLSGFDYRLPLFGVMSALGETSNSIPAAPYIAPNGAATNKKANQINADKSVRAPNGARIGLAWSGRTQTAFTLRYFLSKLDVGDAKLYALQPGETGDDVEPLRPGSDFADVADRISAMDHIISVDTAAVHLAGAMGHPSVHLLLPFLSDWRWHHTARWYPTIKTYRQSNPLDWTAPFAQVNQAISHCRCSLKAAITPSSAANGLEGFP